MKKYLLIIAILFFCLYGCTVSDKTESDKETGKLDTVKEERSLLSNFTVFNKPFSYYNKINWPEAEEADAVTLKKFLKTGKPVIVPGEEKIPSKIDRGEYHTESAEEIYKVDLVEIISKDKGGGICLKKAHIKTDMGIEIFIFYTNTGYLNKKYDIICSVKNGKLISYLQANLYNGSRGPDSADQIPFCNTYIIDKFIDPTIWYIEVCALISYDNNFKEPKWPDGFEQGRFFEIKPDGFIELTNKFDIAIE